MSIEFRNLIDSERLKKFTMHISVEDKINKIRDDFIEQESKRNHD